MDLNVLNGVSFHFSHLMLMEQNWEDGEKYSFFKKERPNDGFMLMNCNSAVYTLANGYELKAGRGALVYLPHHSRYAVRFSHDETVSRSVLMNFILASDDGQPLLLGNDPCIVWENTPTSVQNMLWELLALYNRSSYQTVRLKIQAYSFFEKLLEQRQNRKGDIIDGISYIHTHLDANVSVGELAKMCAMSESSFRSKFKVQMGQSPTTYIINEKMERAKELLMSNELSVEQIAELLNFYDATYFCKCFKKATGMTTAAFKEQFQK